MEQQFNEKQSLELIARMIENTKNNLGRGSGNILISWGVSTLLAATMVGICLLITDGDPRANWLWFLIPFYGLTSSAMRKKTKKVYTHIDRLTKSIWLFITPITIALPVIIVAMDYCAGGMVAMIPFLEMLIISIGLSITGIIINYRPLIIGGSVAVVMSFGCLILVGEPYLLMFWFGVWALISMVIPGVKLNNYAKKNA